MKSDITRNTFDPTNHFSRVLMQQGRVQLDADWNEQVSSLLHYLRAFATDVIGHAGGPVAACGFALTPSGKDEKSDLTIGPGRYYVEGLLCENEQDVSIFAQAVPPDLTSDSLAKLSKSVGLYLDVWERHVTALEDDRIREVALGGPDTATRAQVTWRVNVLPDVPESKGGIRGDVELVNALRTWEMKGAHRGLLKAQIMPQTPAGDPCEMSPETAYLGAENQLYRVEIHQGGPLTKATFKWSRDNGSVAASWLHTDGLTVTVTGVHDQTRGFSPGQWVELSDEAYDLQGLPGTFVQLTKVEGQVLTFAPPATPTTIDPTKPGKATVRRWDQLETDTLSLTDGAIPITEADDAWITLEDGVQVQFQPPPAGAGPSQYRTGDYWLIPARVATKNVEWPQQTVNGASGPAPVGPRGVTHHYAPLGTLALQDGVLTLLDCRCQFPPLGCAYGYYFGGDGIGADLI